MERTCPQQGLCLDCQLDHERKVERSASQVGDREERKDCLVTKSNIGLAFSCDHSAHSRSDCPDDTYIGHQGVRDNHGLIKKKQGYRRLRGAYMSWHDPSSSVRAPSSKTGIAARFDTRFSDDVFKKSLGSMDQNQDNDPENDWYPERFALSDYEGSEKDTDEEEYYDEENSEGLPESRGGGIRPGLSHTNEGDTAMKNQAVRSAVLIFSPNEGAWEEARHELPSFTRWPAAVPFDILDRSAWPGEHHANNSDMADSLHSALSTTERLLLAHSRLAAHLAERHSTRLFQNRTTEFFQSRYRLGSSCGPFGSARTETNGDSNGIMIPPHNPSMFAEDSFSHEVLSSSKFGRDKGSGSPISTSHSSSSLLQPSSLVSIEDDNLLEDPFISPSFTRNPQSGKTRSGNLLPGRGLSFSGPDTSDGLFDTPGKRPFGDQFIIPRPPLRTVNRIRRESSLNDPLMSPRRRPRRCTHRLHGFGVTARSYNESSMSKYIAKSERRTEGEQPKAP